MTQLDWPTVIGQITRDYELDGCFFVDRNELRFVGETPPMAFQNYLGSLIRSKPLSYWEETHFFKFKDGAKVTKYLALIPLREARVAFHFLGLIYSTPEELQDLLKHKILPLHLVFWLRQTVFEKLAEEARQKERSQLLEELETKRHYADQLEHKVHDLQDEIQKINHSKLTTAQKVEKLNRLLKEQSQEFQFLATNHQEVFNAYQSLEREFLRVSAELEQRVHELELENEDLKSGKPARSGNEQTMRETMIDLRNKLEAAQKMNRHLSDQNQNMRKALGMISPDKAGQLVSTVTELKEQMDAVRRRNLQLEMEVKRLRK